MPKTFAEAVASLRPPKKKWPYVGRHFGKWVVVESAGHDSNDRLWLCECTCGATAIVRQYNLLSGRSRGCMACRDTTPKRWRRAKAGGSIRP